MPTPSRGPGFPRFLARQAAAAAVGGISLGILLAALLLYVGYVSGDLSFELEFSRGDAPWFLLVPPALFVVLAVVVSPLSYLLTTFGRRLWGRRRGDD